MEIHGIGCDLIEVERIKRAIERQGTTFINRLFTPQEQEYCSQCTNPFPRYAARFAAKEAVSKALGCGIGSKLNWLDIDIKSQADGPPIATLSAKAQSAFLGVTIQLSISHTEVYAIAYAIAVRAEEI